MIRFNLRCEDDHEFDGWFASSDAFDEQRRRGLVTCPQCHTKQVEKALMAPQVSTGRVKEAISVATMDQTRKAVFAEMKKLRDSVTEKGENVGPRFAEEARKIHYGEADDRLVYGEADREQIEGLVEEGIEIAPLPTLPDDAN
ncbi:MAG: DUF1178 family protein [Pseudomonadota bacterium]